MTTLCYNEGEMQTVHQEESIFQHCSRLIYLEESKFRLVIFLPLHLRACLHDNALRLTNLASLPFKKGSPLRPVVG